MTIKGGWHYYIHSTVSQVQLLFFGIVLWNAVNILQACELNNAFQTILRLNFSTDRHHFDNPVYSTSFRGGGPGPSGATPNTNPVQSTHLPLNNGCSRVVNHFSTSASSCSNTAKKHVNIERDKLGVDRGGQGACGGPNTSVPNHYQDDTEEEMEHESGNFAQCICSSYKWLWSSQGTPELSRGGRETSPPQNYKRNQKLQFAVPFFSAANTVDTNRTLIEANSF